jgi:hypothetical protein
MAMAETSDRHGCGDTKIRISIILITNNRNIAKTTLPTKENYVLSRMRKRYSTRVKILPRMWVQLSNWF